MVAAANKTVIAKANVSSQKLRANKKRISPNPIFRLINPDILRVKRKTNTNIKKRVSSISEFTKFPFTIPARVSGSVKQ